MYFQPPEWAAHERCWMAWPRASNWGKGWQQAQRAYAKVANTISEFEPVVMLIDAAQQASAKKHLSSQVQCLELPYDDAWLRDTAAVFVFDEQQQLRALGWNFNGWGDKFRPWDNDRALAANIAEYVGVPMVKAGIIAEGGAMHTNGNGLLLTTRQCLLNSNRNPQHSQSAIEEHLQKSTGAHRVIWLPQGLVDDHTDGHIDELACFVAADRILLLDTDDTGDANYPVFQQARQVLADYNESADQPLQITAVPQPSACYADGKRLSLSYINYYLANGAIIAPSFDQKRTDANAHSILAEQFPGRQLVSCPALDIATGGGGIHCITQQQPAVAPV